MGGLITGLLDGGAVVFFAFEFDGEVDELAEDEDEQVERPADDAEEGHGHLWLSYQLQRVRWVGRSSSIYPA